MSNVPFKMSSNPKAAASDQGVVGTHERPNGPANEEHAEGDPKHRPTTALNRGKGELINGREQETAPSIRPTVSPT